MTRILPIGLHWLGPEPEHDLCAHGGVEVWVGDERFIDADTDEWALSTAALHLLRTLRTDHTPEAPVAEHLVPCCGHCMYVTEEGLLVNLGCANGLNWWVRHENEVVHLTRPDGLVHSTPSHEWRTAVLTFADAVDAFYAASTAREPCDEHDAFWFAALRAEWAELRA